MVEWMREYLLAASHTATLQVHSVRGGFVDVISGVGDLATCHGGSGSRCIGIPLNSVSPALRREHVEHEVLTSMGAFEGSSRDTRSEG